MEEDGEVKGKKEAGKEWTLMEDEEKCGACVKEGVECWVDLAVVEKWIQDWMEEEKKGRAKPVTRNPSGTNCERCTQKKVACILPATRKMRAVKASGSKSGSKAGGSKAPSVASSGRKRGAKQLEVEIPVAKRMRVTEAEDAEEEDVGAAFRREVLTVLSRLASGVERIAAVAEGMEFRNRQERREAEKATDKDAEGSEEESSEESDEEME
jgi:hypothetical protein